MGREEYLKELEWLYMELYNDREAFDYFVQMLEKNRAERRESLRCETGTPFLLHIL